MTEATFPITGDPDDGALLLDDPFALLLGMLLDQQVPMEWAFRSPSRLRERMEAAEPGSFSPAGLAALSEDRAVELFSEKPPFTATPSRWASGHTRWPRCSSTSTTGWRRPSGPPQPTAPSCIGACAPCPGTGRRRPDLRRPAGQASWHPSGRLAGGGGGVRRRRAPISRRRGQRR